MIQEAHEIRENQSYRNLSATSNVNVGGGLNKQNITEESVNYLLVNISFEYLIILISFLG